MDSKTEALLLDAARSLINWSNRHLPNCSLCGAVGFESFHSPDCPVALAVEAVRSSWLDAHPTEKRA